ncbi:MAG: site-2 protease family protein [Actinobacteria bacterium]|nr:site-2 protease family protein [Actinomycetota bacterium]
MEQYPQEWRQYDPIQPRGTDWRGIFRKLWAPIAAIGAFLAKFGVVLLKFKFLFSMFVSAAFYVWLGGWWFGIGLVVLLFVHEMGHVLEAKRQRLPVSAPVFIPFMGALITLKQMPHNAWNEAKLAIAGPIVGSAGALALYVAGVAFDSRALKALAFLGFFINLFNLLPVVPLDGGRIVAALHPVLWLVGFVALLGLCIWRPNPILIIILLFSASELWRRWKMRRHPEMQDYYRVDPHQRLIIGVLYFGLAALLVLGMAETHVPRDF